MTLRFHVAWMIAAVGVVLAGCTTSPPPPPQASGPPRTLTPAYAGAPTLPPPDLTDTGPGSLVSVKPVASQIVFDQVDAAAVRVVYRSTSGDTGEPTEVSGVVAVPPGKPPKGGWPILAFGHDITGLANPCAPSLSTDLAGYAGVISVILSRGYVVAMTDYQGLGLPGDKHSLVDVAALGNSVIDVARAARHVFPETSTRWGAFGLGEGGVAAWSAAERAGGYGSGLDLVGAAAVSPLADLSSLADAAENGTLTVDQQRLQMLVVESLVASRGFDPEDYRSPAARERWNVLTDCAPADPESALRAQQGLVAADLRPVSPAATAQLRQALVDAALPQNTGSPLAAPILVVYATDDPLIPASWTNRALARACAEGDPIEVSSMIGDTTTKTEQVMQGALDWLQARFDGQRVASVCRGIA